MLKQLTKASETSREKKHGEENISLQPHEQCHQTESEISSNEQNKVTYAKRLRGIIKKLKTEGAAEPNGLPNALLKQAPDFWADYLTPLFNHIYSQNMVPNSWKGNIIHPIFKQGNHSKPENYRLISLIDVQAKLHASCLLADLQDWINEKSIIPKFKTGFRSGMGTTTNLATLALLTEKAVKRKTQLLACFIPLKSAFDRVTRI